MNTTIDSEKATVPELGAPQAKDKPTSAKKPNGFCFRAWA
jgi:hypothetical protein